MNVDVPADADVPMDVDEVRHDGEVDERMRRCRTKPHETKPSSYTIQLRYIRSQAKQQALASGLKSGKLFLPVRDGDVHDAPALVRVMTESASWTTSLLTDVFDEQKLELELLAVLVGLKSTSMDGLPKAVILPDSVAGAIETVMEDMSGSLLLLSIFDVLDSDVVTRIRWNLLIAQPLAHTVPTLLPTGFARASAEFSAGVQAAISLATPTQMLFQPAASLVWRTTSRASSLESFSGERRLAWHGTSLSNLNDILLAGLQPAKSKDWLQVGRSEHAWRAARFSHHSHLRFSLVRART